MKTQGIVIVARILNRFPGTNSLDLQYQIDNEVFERRIETSTDVYLEFTGKDHMEIRVLKDNPRFITWEGDRFFQIAIFQLILSIISIVILLFTLILGICTLIK